MATGDTSNALMLVRFAPKEIMELCTNDENYALVTVALFETAANGGDISGEPVDVQAAVNAAVAVLARAVSDANSEKAVYLSGYTVNADAADFISNLTSDVARYYLYDNAVLPSDSVILLRYQGAIDKFKAAVGCTECALPGVGDMDSTSEGNDIDSVFYAPDAVFSDSNLAKFN